MSTLRNADPQVYAILKSERRRQQDTLTLIPSENFFSPAVREAAGSVFMHKYAEGNIGQRYYEGCRYIDELEALAIKRASQAFRLPAEWSVNVQALSGSNANIAVYLALLESHDTILSLYLPDGGHLSHGWSYDPQHYVDPSSPVSVGGKRKVHIVSKLFATVQYKTDLQSQQIDYGTLEKIAREYKPKLIITGGTAYPRTIDHRRIKHIAKRVDALYLADIAHEAGLVAAGVLPSPVTIADIVTMTTHKTLRAGRGALILAHRDFIKKINKAVMPGLQGGPHYHNIAALCVGLGEALTPQFKRYARQVIINAQALARELTKLRFHLVTGGTDKHLVLINLTEEPLLGKKFARALDWAGIVANFNTMPQETRPPADPSALRLGTPWVTTRGMRVREMKRIAGWLREVMNICDPWGQLPFNEFEEKIRYSAEIKAISRDVKQLCRRFPLAL